MDNLSITLKKGNLYKEKQEISFTNNIITLIGENGSGKSSILEAIFEENIDSELLHEQQLTICYTSGQNELYSELFYKYKSKSKKYLKNTNANINTFYFDYSWIRLLIFFSSIYKKDGMVRSYLKNKNYIKINEYDEDISSHLSFPFSIKKNYVDRVRLEIQQEEDMIQTENPLRSTFYHTIIESLIKEFYPHEFNWISGYNIVKRSCNLSYINVHNIFNNDINQTFTFWALASNSYDYNTNFDDIGLFFDNSMELQQLSDGEYQLLSIYAMIDLFDSLDTVYLFDEIDAHMHHKNIKTLWNSINSSLQGKVITTTHAPDTMVYNPFDSLKFVENGELKRGWGIYEISDRLSIFTEEVYQPQRLAAKTEYIALIEDKTDWIIFEHLAKKKLGNEFNEEKFKKIGIIKCPCGYNGNDEFAKNQKKWAKKLSEISKAELKTKKIFFICDRDDLQIHKLHSRASDKVKNNPNFLVIPESTDLLNLELGKIKPFMFIWRRREIENYLLTYTVLEKYGLLEIASDQLGKVNLPQRHQTMDGNKTIKEGDFKELLGALLYKDNNNGNITIGRWSYEKLYNILNLIPIEEISNDIVYMYNNIIKQIQ